MLNQAVALSLAGETGQLAALHRAYAPAMEATPFGADFQAIAAVNTRARDFADVVDRIAAADEFKAFMKSYRARLAGKPATSAGS